jgi:hypothetical protein
MSIGDQWKGFMGNSMNYEEAEKFLDTYYEAGGNVCTTSYSTNVSC